jgi:hypothetical protein
LGLPCLEVCLLLGALLLPLLLLMRLLMLRLLMLLLAECALLLKKIKLYFVCPNLSNFA